MLAARVAVVLVWKNVGRHATLAFGTCNPYRELPEYILGQSRGLVASRTISSNEPTAHALHQNCLLVALRALRAPGNAYRVNLPETTNVRVNRVNSHLLLPFATSSAELLSILVSIGWFEAFQLRNTFSNVLQRSENEIPAIEGFSRCGGILLPQGLAGQEKMKRVAQNYRCRNSSRFALRRAAIQRSR